MSGVIVDQDALLAWARDVRAGGERQGVDDVAECAEPDNQEGSPRHILVRVALWRGLRHGVSPRTAATRSFVE